MNQYLKKYVKEQFKKPGTALDLGAGNFFDVACMNQLGWECVGVDKNMGVDLETPFLSAQAPFDLVFSNYVIHKLKNKDQFIKTAYENLKQGGKIFIHTFHESDSNSKNGMEEKYIGDLFSEVGFGNIKTSIFDFYDNEIGHGHWHKILEVTATKK